MNPPTDSDRIVTQHDAARCPLCGGPNECAMCQSNQDCHSDVANSTFVQPGARVGAGTTNPVCWCASQEIPATLIARVPDALRDRACICRACVEKYKRAVQSAFTLIELLVVIAII